MQARLDSFFINFLRKPAMEKQPREIKPSEKGQSLVELGFALVIMLILLAGVVDLGTIIFEYVTMRDAGQEGAAYASVYPTACSQIAERVKSNLRVQDNTDTVVTVQINGNNCSSDVAYTGLACAPNAIKVIVSQPHYRITTPLLGTILGSNTLNIRASITDTIIRPLACP